MRISPVLNSRVLARLDSSPNINLVVHSACYQVLAIVSMNSSDQALVVAQSVRQLFKCLALFQKSTYHEFSQCISTDQDPFILVCAFFDINARYFCRWKVFLGNQLHCVPVEHMNVALDCTHKNKFLKCFHWCGILLNLAWGMNGILCKCAYFGGDSEHTVIGSARLTSQPEFGVVSMHSKLKKGYIWVSWWFWSREICERLPSVQTTLMLLSAWLYAALTIKPGDW